VLNFADVAIDVGVEIAIDANYFNIKKQCNRGFHYVAGLTAFNGKVVSGVRERT